MPALVTITQDNYDDEMASESSSNATNSSLVEGSDNGDDESMSASENDGVEEGSDDEEDGEEENKDGPEAEDNSDEESDGGAEEVESDRTQEEEEEEDEEDEENEDATDQYHNSPHVKREEEDGGVNDGTSDEEDEEEEEEENGQETAPNVGAVNNSFSSRKHMADLFEARRHAELLVDEVAAELKAAEIALAKMKQRRDAVALKHSQASENLKRAILEAEPSELALPSQWNTMFHRLVQYRKEHGHCFVPHNREDKELYQLNRWIGNQRMFYNKTQQGPKQLIKRHRVAALERIGFVWNVKDWRWQQQYQQLLQFRNEYGHCDIPRTSDKYRELSDWIKRQYALYEKYRRSESSVLTDEQVRKLVAIGFPWRQESTPSKTRQHQEEEQATVAYEQQTKPENLNGSHQSSQKKTESAATTTTTKKTTKVKSQIDNTQKGKKTETTKPDQTCSSNEPTQKPKTSSNFQKELMRMMQFQQQAQANPPKRRKKTANQTTKPLIQSSQQQQQQPPNNLHGLGSLYEQAAKSSED